VRTIDFLKRNRPFVMIVVGVLGISLSAIFVKYSSAPSSVTAAYRLLWTVLLMSPAVFLKKSNRREFSEVFRSDKKTAFLSCVSGIFLAIHFVLWFESLSLTSVASSTSIVCTEVIWVALGFCIFLKGRLSRNAILCIALALVGSIMIAFADSTAGGTLKGDILALVSAIAVAVYTLIGRQVRTNTSTTVYTYIVYVSCALVLVGTVFVQDVGLFSYGLSPVFVGFFLSVFSTILGHSIFSWCLKFFSPSFVSASKLCEPVVASLFAIILFQEIPSFLQISGGLLTVAGVFLYSLVERKES